MPNPQYVSNACLSEHHTRCRAGGSHPGGHQCICACHMDRIDQEHLDRASQTIGEAVRLLREALQLQRSSGGEDASVVRMLGGQLLKNHPHTLAGTAAVALYELATATCRRDWETCHD